MINYTEPKLKDFKCFKLPIDGLPKCKELLILGNVYNFFGTYKDGDLSDFTQTPWSGEGAADNFMNFGQFVMNGGHATIIATKETCNYYRKLYKEFYKAGFGTTHPKVVLFEIDDTKFLKGNFKIKDGKEEKLVKGEYFWAQGKDGKWEFNYSDFLKSFFENGEKRMFDLIIANPPYGNDASTAKAIAKQLLKLFPETILLAPKNCFKAKEIEKHVQTFKCTENVFEGVSIAGLTIARLSKVEGNFKYSMLEEMHLKGVRKYIYMYNNIQKEKGLPYKLQAGNTQLSVWKKKGSTVENTFMLGVWGCNKQGWARKWNVDNNENAIYEPTSKKGGAPMTNYGALSACGIIFQSKEERDNLVNWFYSTKIYREESVTCAFIPFVDWSRSWTDEEILKELGLPEDFLKEKE